MLPDARLLRADELLHRHFGGTGSSGGTYLGVISVVNISEENIYGENISAENVSGENISGKNIFCGNVSGMNVSGENLSDDYISVENIFCLFYVGIVLRMDISGGY